MDSRNPSRYIGLDNYVRLVTRDSRYHESLINASVVALGFDPVPWLRSAAFVMPTLIIAGLAAGAVRG